MVAIYCQSIISHCIHSVWKSFSSKYGSFAASVANALQNSETIHLSGASILLVIFCLKLNSSAAWIAVQYIMYKFPGILSTSHWYMCLQESGQLRNLSICDAEIVLNSIGFWVIVSVVIWCPLDINCTCILLQVHYTYSALLLNRYISERRKRTFESMLLNSSAVESFHSCMTCTKSISSGTSKTKTQPLVSFLLPSVSVSFIFLWSNQQAKLKSWVRYIFSRIIKLKFKN